MTKAEAQAECERRWVTGVAWTRKREGQTVRCVGAVEARDVGSTGLVATYRIAYGEGSTWEQAFEDVERRRELVREDAGL